MAHQRIDNTVKRPVLVIDTLKTLFQPLRQGQSVTRRQKRMTVPDVEEASFHPLTLPAEAPSGGSSYHVAMTDHYVPGPNAHIDTTDFEREIGELAGDSTGIDLMKLELAPTIYEAMERRIAIDPDEPSPTAILCRYMTVEKFLWFLHSQSVYFGGVSGFDDPRDCTVPEDYEHAVQRFYLARECVPADWDVQVDRARNRWLISCWTEVSSSIDDYLLWHRYAGGQNGVAITATYEQLKQTLLTGLGEQRGLLSKMECLKSGYVSYDEGLRLLPFNKRGMFKNEKEVRFVGRTDFKSSANVPVHELFPELGLRLSPDAASFHHESVIELWKRFGGSDNIIISEG